MADPTFGAPTCKGCADPLPPRIGRGQRVWCSPKCRRQTKAKQEREARPPRLCPACSQVLTLRAEGKGGHNQLYCNLACAVWAKRHPGVARPVSRVCTECEGDIGNRVITAKFCSDRCRDIHSGRIKRPMPVRVCALEECTATFTPKQERQRCCSEKHGKIHSHRMYRAAGKEVREPWGDQRREAYHRRRALKKNASTGDPVRFTEIAERDQWTCGICSTPVDASLVWPDPKSPSLDHVIPLAKGGAHDPSNVVLAHLRCNTIKNARLSETPLLPM